MGQNIGVEHFGGWIEADHRIRPEIAGPYDVRVVDEDGVRLGALPGRCHVSQVSVSGVYRLRLPALHSLTQIRPCESDHTRALPAREWAAR